jgi:mRNA interferase RelE/StbE
VKYLIEYENKAFKALMKIPEKERAVIKNAIDRLADDPIRKSNVKKLLNRPGYRLRVGNFRVLFEIDSETKNILIISVGHRKKVYRR